MEPLKDNYIRMCGVLQLILDNLDDNQRLLSLFVLLYRNEYKICITVSQLKIINRFSNKFDERCFKLWNYLKYRDMFIVQII